MPGGGGRHGPLVANGAAAAACRHRRRRRAERARAGPLQAGHLRRRRPAELAQGGVVPCVRLRVPPRARAMLCTMMGAVTLRRSSRARGVVAGRCALHSRYGGGPVGVSGGSPVVRQQREGARCEVRRAGRGDRLGGEGQRAGKALMAAVLDVLEDFRGQRWLDDRLCGWR